MTEINKINSDEFELYDRQIRLWGLDAQNRYFYYKIRKFF